MRTMRLADVTRLPVVAAMAVAVVVIYGGVWLVKGSRAFLLDHVQGALPCSVGAGRQWLRARARIRNDKAEDVLRHEAMGG